MKERRNTKDINTRSVIDQKISILQTSGDHLSQKAKGIKQKIDPLNEEAINWRY
jgi:hypothetical protein